MTRRERQKRHRRRHGRPLRRALIVIATLLIVAATAGGIAFAGWVVSVVQDTPDIQDLKPRPQGAVSTVYAADGTRLGFIASDTLRRAIPGSQIPLVMKRATVAIEDKRFYKHGGVDYVGVVRAAVKNVDVRRRAAGRLDADDAARAQPLHAQHALQKTFTRKIREAKLAEELENEHSKEWVLVAYLNNVPYGTVGGQTAVGVQAAARIFFNKPASALTLPQAALLAGLPQAPTQYNPFNNPSGARKRRGEVLQAMVDAGYITQGAGRRGERRAARRAPQQLLRAPARAVLLRLRQKRADQTLRPPRRRAGRAEGLHDDQPEIPGARAPGDRETTSATPAPRRPRSRPSTPTTATSSRWPPRRRTARRSSTTRRRRTGSRARRSR